MRQIKRNISTAAPTANRLEALTDGLFAIVMTLLVLEFNVPVIASGPVNTELFQKLLELWPKLLVYMLTFLILGILWVNHRSTFQYITRTDGKLAWMNIIILMFVALIPFSASLLGEYSYTKVAVAAYGINITIIFTMSLVLWIYVTGKHALADRAIDADIVTQRKFMFLICCFFYALGIGISFISPVASLFIYILVSVMSIIITWKDSHGYLSKMILNLTKSKKR